MIATRTLSSLRGDRPFALPLVEAIRPSREKLLAYGENSLCHREQRRRGQHVDRPLERNAERRQDQARGDDDHALRAAAETYVPAQADQLGLRPRIRDEERAGDRR